MKAIRPNPVHTLLFATAFVPGVGLTGCDEATDAEVAEDAEEIEAFTDPLDGATTGEVDLDPVPEEPGDGEGPGGFRAPIDPMSASTTGYWSWGTPGNVGPRLSLGSDGTKTCFLQGVTGELSSKRYGLPARASVYRENGQWWVETDAGLPEIWGYGGSGVMAHVACIPYVSNRRELHWSGQNVDNEYGDAIAYLDDTGTTRCFMTEVRGTNGWFQPTSHVELEHKMMAYGGSGLFLGWQLDGVLTPSAGAAGGSASAVCVDIPNQQVIDYSLSSGDTVSGVRAAPKPGTVCAVHRLEGRFGNNDEYGWDDGARVYPSSWFGNDNWNVIGTSSKSISGECYKTRARSG